jgi:hypothetical protein
MTNLPKKKKKKKDEEVVMTNYRFCMDIIVEILIPDIRQKWLAICK